jgi:hypothetical protein
VLAGSISPPAGGGFDREVDSKCNRSHEAVQAGGIEKIFSSPATRAWRRGQDRRSLGLYGTADFERHGAQSGYEARSLSSPFISRCMNSHGAVRSSCHHPCKARFRLAGSPLPGELNPLDRYKRFQITFPSSFSGFVLAQGKLHFEPPFTSFDHLVGAGEQRGWHFRGRVLLPLMTSSYLVGACTGRSAGLSSFRMRISKIAR